MTADPDTTSIDQDISIDAPPADIFALLAKLEPVLDACPRTTVTPAGEGVAVTHSGMMDENEPPITLRVQPHVTDVEEPTALTMAIDGTIQGTVAWTLQPHDDSTLATAALTYTLASQDLEATIDEAGAEVNGAGLASQSAIVSSITAALDDVLTTLQALSEQHPPPVSMARGEIPAIDCPFPAEISPHLDEVTAHTRDWVQQLGVTEIKEPPAGLAELLRLACRVHPHAPLDALCLCSDWYSWVFLVDDYLDPTERGTDPAEMEHFQQPLLAVLEGESPESHETPLVRAFIDIWQRASARMPPAWQERFAQHHRDVFAAQHWEADNRGLDHIPERTTYIKNRWRTAGVYPAFDMAELGKDIIIPPDIYQREAVTALRKVVANVIAWTNDVCSLRKELADGEVNNFVVVVRNEQSCSVQQAITEICELIEAEIRRFEALSQRITADSGMNSELSAYQTALERWMRGNLEWSKETARYGTPD